MTPIIKYNGGNFVILCNKCRVIINYMSFFDKIKQNYPLYCRECDEKLNREFYNGKSNTNKE